MSDLQEPTRGDEPVGYDSARHLVTGLLGTVHLRPKEHAILCQLIVHTGETVSNERLYTACWPDPDHEPHGTARENGNRWTPKRDCWEP